MLYATLASVLSEIAKKGLTKGKMDDIMDRHPKRAEAQKRGRDGARKNRKFFRKTSQKGVDKRESLWYNQKAVSRGAAKSVFEN